MPFKAHAPIYLAGKIASMESMEFWFWMMRDDWGRVRKCVCRFTEAEALKRDPTAERVPGSVEVRRCPEAGGLERWSNAAFAGWDRQVDGGRRL